MTYKSEYYCILRKAVVFAVVLIMIANGLAVASNDIENKNSGIFYFISAGAPQVKIISANRQALKDTPHKEDLVWISEKPDYFENRFLFNINCFKMSIILAVFLIALKGICSKSSYMKRLFHIRI